MAVTKSQHSTKYVVEYLDESGKLDSRWHYDKSVNKYGPSMVEQFSMPRKEREKKKSVDKLV